MTAASLAVKSLASIPLSLIPFPAIAGGYKGGYFATPSYEISNQLIFLSSTYRYYIIHYGRLKNVFVAGE